MSFESADSLKLPLTTTKRSLETSSDVYLQVRQYMMEGTKVFTSFTNSWKTRERDTSDAFKAAVQKPVAELGDDLEPDVWSKVAKVASTGEGNEAR